MEETKIGKIVHFFGNINVAVVELSESVKQGDTIHIKGSSTDFEQILDSMQIDHKSVTEASASDSIGLKLTDNAKEGDIVYKIK